MSLTISGHDGLSARSFSISESMSKPFDASIVALASGDDLDLEALVGAEASLSVDAGDGERTWTGVVAHAEQVQAEETGLSTYAIGIVPRLALLAHRSHSRVFQHLNVPKIVEKVLHDFDIQVRAEIDAAAYPVHEYRVQHGESDLAFISRLLEDAGIAYYLDADAQHGSIVVLTDRAHRREPTLSLRYLEHPSPNATGAYITSLSLKRSMGPGSHTVRDHDFRKHRGVALSGSASSAGIESSLGQTHHAQGAIVRHGEHRAEELARIGLESDRAHLKTATFHATTIRLAPGTVFRLEGHPRADLALDKPLLSLENVIEGSSYGDLFVHGVAAPASVSHRPSKKTARPHVSGVESGVVVGPKGESVHTDEHGRVRVQLAWDHEQGFDESSSCWVRVSQPWAGQGFGMIAVPRVGQEVLVGFFGGDPDQPIIVGRVYNAENTSPWKLPENRTKTGLRTASVPSTPDEDAYNEIGFEDKRGHELLNIHAERDLELFVKGNEIERTGQDRTLSVGKNRTATVGAIDSTLVGHKHSVAIITDGAAGSTRLEMSDKKIVCTTGEATVTFDGPDLSLEAQGNITIVAHDGDVIIKGGPNVKINC